MRRYPYTYLGCGVHGSWIVVNYPQGKNHREADSPWVTCIHLLSPHTKTTIRPWDVSNTWCNATKLARIATPRILWQIGCAVEKKNDFLTDYDAYPRRSGFLIASQHWFYPYRKYGTFAFNNPKDIQTATPVNNNLLLYHHTATAEESIRWIFLHIEFYAQLVILAPRLWCLQQLASPTHTTTSLSTQLIPPCPRLRCALRSHCNEWRLRMSLNT